MKTKILCLAGSNRKSSFNNQLLSVACKFAIENGAEVNHIHLSDYPLPIFDQDIEAQGFPEHASKLKELFKSHDALMLACPEYNGSITPLLKNVIDWVSRPTGDDGPLEAYRGKTACLISASPGALGGLRGLRHVREILSNIGVLVVPEQFALSSAMSAFNDDGQLQDPKNSERLGGVVASLVNTSRKQRSEP